MDKPTGEAIGAKTLVGVRSVTTIVTGQFDELAKKFNMTPEYLASLAIRQFVDSKPTELNVISASPLNEQQCDTCPMMTSCSSAPRREKEHLICFERLVPLAVSAIVALCLPLAGQIVLRRTCPVLYARQSRSPFLGRAHRVDLEFRSGQRAV